MLKILRKIIIIICCFLLSWGFIVPVSADSPYYVMADEYSNVNVWHDGWVKTSGSTPGLRQFRSLHAAGYNVPFYSFIALVGSDYHVFFINEKVRNSGATIYGRREISAGSYGSQFNFDSNYDYSFSIGAANYHYNIIHLGPATGEFMDTGDIIALAPSSVLPVVNFGSVSLTKQDIYNYVYNNESPGVSYGDPVVDYNVSVAGTGQAAANNKDNITFYNYFKDGSVVPENAVFSLRVVPGYYQAENRENIFTKTYHDFVLNTEKYSLGDFSPGETVSFLWSDLIKDFVPFERWGIGGVLTPFISNEVWQMLGWSYQYKLTIDDYESDWTTIYTATSSGATESYDITNTYYNEEVYNAFQTINNVNNITNNIYIYGGSSVPVSAPATPTPTPTPDSVVSDPVAHDFLGSILNFIRSLFSTLGDLVDKLFSALGGLIDWFNDLFVGNFSDYEDELDSAISDIKDDSGVLYECFGVIDGLKDSLYNTTPSDPVITYNDFKIDDVVLIPAGSIDFRNLFDSLGVQQDYVYAFSDFWILLYVVLMLGRKVISALGGSEEA